MIVGHNTVSKICVSSCGQVVFTDAMLSRSYQPGGNGALGLGWEALEIFGDTIRVVHGAGHVEAPRAMA